MSLFRTRGTADGERVENVELFFDLVFVFAVTRLSHTLLEDLTTAGALRVALLIFAVWWVWIYTSWVTNWLAPERPPVRICLFVMMIAGLLLAVSIPHAFDRHALLFAASYVFMQVGRTAFFLWAARESSLAMRRNFQRILIWMCASAVFWLCGALIAHAQPLLWALAMGLELLGPFAFYWVPGLGRSTTLSWNISGAHLAERCGLFIIIGLGESLLVTGTTFAELPWTARSLTALGSAVIGSILMWWIYFDTGAGRAHHRIVHSDDPGRQGRLAYTYLHVLIVAGIIVCAVADELVLAGIGSAMEGHQAAGHRGGVAWITILAGPLLYVIGTALFKWATNDRRTPPLSHLIGIALLLALTWPARTHMLSSLGMSIATTGVLLIVALWESRALKAEREHP
jgi:low temperature requirement protein LtrA